MRHKRRLVVLTAVVTTAIGCSVAGPSGSPAEAPSADASPVPTAASQLPTVALSPSPNRSISVAGRPPFDSPVPAAAFVLEQSSARFDLRIDRFKPDLPDEVSAVASGIVDPAGDRGSMRYEFFPDAPADDPLALPPFDVAWDADDYWVATDQSDADWQHTTRDKAPEMAVIGRVNEEPLALLRLVAAADPGTVKALPAETLDGVAADRWLVPVPVAAARAAFVPPETYLAFDTIFEVDDLPVEVWLVDGQIARVGYVFEREKAPYGGPDRIETWYAWSAIGEPIDLVLPPEGTIVEVGG